MNRRTILWHCPPGHLGRGSRLTGPRLQALKNAGEQPGARSGKKEESKLLTRQGRPWRLTSGSKAGFPIASLTVPLPAQCQHTSRSLRVLYLESLAAPGARLGH